MSQGGRRGLGCPAKLQASDWVYPSSAVAAFALFCASTPTRPRLSCWGVVNSCPQVAGAVEPRVVLRRGTSLGDPWGGSCGVGAALEGRGGEGGGCPKRGLSPRGEGVVPSVLRPGLQPPGARWQGASPALGSQLMERMQDARWCGRKVGHIISHQRCQKQAAGDPSCCSGCWWFLPLLCVCVCV